MKFKIVPTPFYESIAVGISPRYMVMHKRKWWCFWRFIHNREPHKQVNEWRTRKGAQAYINQEKKRLNIK